MRIHSDFIVDSFKDDRLHLAADGGGFIIAYNDVLGTDNNVNGFVFGKALVDTLERLTCKLNFKVLVHNAVDDVALSDKVSNKGILWLVVNILRSADLLDFTVLHNHHPVGHGQCLLLVVGNINEGNLQRLLNPHQLGLHLLAQL